MRILNYVRQLGRSPRFRLVRFPFSAIFDRNRPHRFPRYHSFLPVVEFFAAHMVDETLVSDDTWIGESLSTQCCWIYGWELTYHSPERHWPLWQPMCVVSLYELWGNQRSVDILLYSYAVELAWVTVLHFSNNFRFDRAGEWTSFAHPSALFGGVIKIHVKCLNAEHAEQMDLRFRRACVSLLYLTLGRWNRPPWATRSLGHESILKFNSYLSRGLSKLKCKSQYNRIEMVCWFCFVDCVSQAT